MANDKIIADIIAEMRRDADNDDSTPDGILGQTLNYYADRFEATLRPEFARMESDAYAVGGIEDAMTKTGATYESSLTELQRNEISKIGHEIKKACICADGYNEKGIDITILDTYRLSPLEKAYLLDWLSKENIIVEDEDWLSYKNNNKK